MIKVLCWAMFPYALGLAFARELAWLGLDVAREISDLGHR